jgi:cobalt-zinc-cadmium efflux system membrane fusion protein
MREEHRSRVSISRSRISGRWCLALAALLILSACGTDPSAPAPVEPPSGTEQVVAAVDWCAGHGLPESKCTKCNPELTAGFQAAGDWCAEHGFPESACPLCNPVAPPPDEGAEAFAPGTRIRFRSPEIEQATGIEMEPARSARLETDVSCTARIVFDRNRLADVRASVPGVVREVKVDLGERVDEGAELFVLESAAIGDLQGRLRAAQEHVDVARANYQRQLRLSESEITSQRQVELAREELETEEAELRAIEAGLRITGAVDSGLQGRFRERSPIAGTVIRRPATIGTFATNETSLATIADTSRMWAWLEIREADAGFVRVGQPVKIVVDALPRHEFSGRVTWIASEVDANTRTVAARAEVANRDGLLRAEQFARATIRVAEAGNALVVPRDAVQRVGDESVVFVRTGDGLYEPRLVSLGRSDRERIEIRGRVRNGDAVVTAGAYLLKTELSRESIGAGCCEVVVQGGS